MAKGKPQPWRNRIIGYGEEAPDQLLANPRNWRVHPKAQQDVLGGVLAEVGIVDTVLVNKQTGFVVDGHLRVGMAISAGQATIPVTYVDLTEAEEALILATFDPIGALAVADDEQLKALLAECETDSEAVKAMLDELAKNNGVGDLAADWESAAGGLPSGDKGRFEQMTFTVSGEQAKIVREALTEAKHKGFGDSDNENSNGNALALVCEDYLGRS